MAKLQLQRFYSNIVPIFDRALKRLHRNNAGRLANSHHVDYIKDEVSARLYDRFLDVKRSFEHVLEFGAGFGHLIKSIESDKIKHLEMVDDAQVMLQRPFRDPIDPHVKYKMTAVAEAESLDPAAFAEGSFDAVISSLYLHWINDLPGTLSQLHRILKPDGLFLAAVFGGDTLYELRSSLQLAEVEREGGFSPRISPMIDAKDVGGLLQSAGFHLLTVDMDELVVTYPSAIHLMDDLSRMGESHATFARNQRITRQTLVAASAVYGEMYGRENAMVPATFQIIYMIGWKKSEHMPKPLERGSARANLGDAL